MKNFLLMLLSGCLLGVITFGIFSPQLISWYYTPPAELVFSCKPTMDWSLETYRKIVVTGMVLGGISFSLLFFALRSARKKPAGAPGGELSR